MSNLLWSSSHSTLLTAETEDKILKSACLTEYSTYLVDVVWRTKNVQWRVSSRLDVQRDAGQSVIDSVESSDCFLAQINWRRTTESIKKAPKNSTLFGLQMPQTLATYTKHFKELHKLQVNGGNPVLLALIFLSPARIICGIRNQLK